MSGADTRAVRLEIVFYGPQNSSTLTPNLVAVGWVRGAGDLM